MRLIDADALHEALNTKQKWVVRCGEKHNEGYAYDQVHFAIDDAPTIEAVSIDDYRSMENTCYKLQKALYEMADRKTESNSEKPNNCEKDCFLCKWLGDVDVCGRCRNRNLFAPKGEPQTEFIACPIHEDDAWLYEDEPQTKCKTCKWGNVADEHCEICGTAGVDNYEPQISAIRTSHRQKGASDDNRYENQGNCGN